MRFYSKFSSGGTASFPGHKFYFTPENSDTKLKEWVIEDYPAGNIMVYDPYFVEGDKEKTEANLAVLSSEERRLYQNLLTCWRYACIRNFRINRDHLLCGYSFVMKRLL